MKPQTEVQSILQQPIAVFALLAVAVALYFSFRGGDTDGGTWWVFGLQGAVAALVVSIHLRASIKAGVLRLTFFPFWRRAIPIGTIASVAAVTYRPIRDFGGWGIRRAFSGRFKGTTVYSIAGKQAILVQVEGGQHVLLGTRDTRAWLLAFEANGVVVQAAESSA